MNNRIQRKIDINIRKTVRWGRRGGRRSTKGGWVERDRDVEEGQKEEEEDSVVGGDKVGEGSILVVEDMVGEGRSEEVERGMVGDGKVGERGTDLDVVGEEGRNSGWEVVGEEERNSE